MNLHFCYLQLVLVLSARYIFLPLTDAKLSRTLHGNDGTRGGTRVEKCHVRRVQLGNGLERCVERAALCVIVELSVEVEGGHAEEPLVGGVQLSHPADNMRQAGQHSIRNNITDRSTPDNTNTARVFVSMKNLC